jgi:methyl-accepting chemotaxis protein
MKFSLDPTRIVKVSLIKVFLKLRISHRLMALLLLPALPIGLESYIIINQINEEITVTEKKMRGMGYLLHLNQLLRYSQAYREHTSGFHILKSDSSLLKMDDSAGRIKSILDNLSKIPSEGVLSAGTRKSLTDLNHDLSAVITQGRKSDIDYKEYYASLSDLNRRQMDLIIQILSESKMILENESLPYHLSYAGMKDLPELMEGYSHSRTFVSLLPSGNKTSQDKNNETIRFISFTRPLMRDLASNVNLVYNLDISVRYIIDANYKKLLKTTADYEKSLESGDEPAILTERSTQAIESMYQFQTMIYNSLNYVYNNRLNTLKREIMITFIVTVSIFLITLIIAMLIVTSILAPLAEASKHAAKITEGDLTNAIPVYGKDEIAGFLTVMNDMTRSLFNIIIKIQDTAWDTDAIAERLTISSQRLLDTSYQQSSASQEATAAMEEMAASAAGITESVTKTAVTMNSINSNLRNLMESIDDESQQMVELSALAKSTAERASGSEKLIRSATDAINQIQASTARITEFTGIITEISDQTNLLSLNAAIEAARAGDSGRGFAVVAQEITRLAERTMQSVSEVSQLIGATLKTVQNGTQHVSLVADNLGSIIIDVQKINSYTSIIMERIKAQGQDVRTLSGHSVSLTQDTHSIEVAVDEQHRVTKEIERTLGELARTGNIVSADATELMGVALNLKNRSESLIQLVEKFMTDEEKQKFSYNGEPERAVKLPDFII